MQPRGQVHCGHVFQKTHTLCPLVSIGSLFQYLTTAAMTRRRSGCTKGNSPPSVRLRSRAHSSSYSSYGSGTRLHLLSCPRCVAPMKSSARPYGHPDPRRCTIPSSCIVPTSAHRRLSHVACGLARHYHDLERILVFEVNAASGPTSDRQLVISRDDSSDFRHVTGTYHPSPRVR